MEFSFAEERNTLKPSHKVTAFFSHKILSENDELHLTKVICNLS